MEDIFHLEINDFGRINNADIEINKINVVGGVNASGKSTASKLLYCFLKANSCNRDSYILPKVIPYLNRLIKYVDNPQGNNNVLDRLSINANKSEVITEYEKYESKFQEIYSNDKSQIESLIFESIKPVIEGLMEDNNVLSSCILSYLLHDESLINFSYEEPYSGIHILNGNIKFYSNSFESLIYNDYHVEVDEEGNNLYFSCETDFDCDDDEFYYLTKGSIKKFNRVFYIGTLSLFDLDKYINSPLIDEKPLFGYEYHMDELITYLSKLNPKKNVPDNIQKIQNKIENMIEGQFKSNVRYYNFSFSQEDNEKIEPVNTSSGIKQIGMLQLLLKNNHLIPGSFLIIDEPEVNLHPEWQFKFAEILVSLAKELGITIYLNSHSPMFIEAIEVLTQYYDLENETNFYLTEKQENGKYDFIKIDYDNLFEIYDNLAKPFDIIEVYRLKNEYKKGNY